MKRFRLTNFRSRAGRAGMAFTAIVFSLTAVIQPLPVWADSNDPETPSSPTDIRSIVTDTAWYDPTAGSCSEADEALVGGDNAEIVFNFFTAPSRRLTAAQASGIMGNLQQESGLRPDAVQTIGGSARGIAQWEGDRFDNLLEFARRRGKSWGELGIQLEFLWREMPKQFAGPLQIDELRRRLPGADNSTSSLEAVKMTSTPTLAAYAFELTFERAGDPVMTNRIRHANQFYERFKNRTLATGEASQDNCEPAETTSGEFIIYNQYDRRWRYKPYGSSTIGEAGCGPSAMAMIVTHLLKKSITPDIVAKYAASQGMYIPGVGSSWAIAGVVARHYGLKSTLIRADSSRIVATLRAGGLVVTSGSGALPFTSGGHYIVIRGIDSQGRWRVGDSGHVATNNRSYAPSHLLSIMNDGNVYAITK